MLDPVGVISFDHYLWMYHYMYIPSASPMIRSLTLFNTIST